MAIRVADACLWLLMAVFVRAAAGQSNLVCSQAPAIVKAGLREGAAIFCQLVNFNYTNSTYVIWSFISRSSAGDNVVVLRDGERKSYYQAIHSDQFPTLDIGRITADTLLYPSYNVTVIQEDVPVLRSQFSLRAVGLETTSKSATLNPSIFEARTSEPTAPTSPPSSRPSTRKSTGTFSTVWFATERQEVSTDIPGRIPSTIGDNLHPTATIAQTSRVLTNPQGRTSPPPSNVDNGSLDRPSFQCNQYPSIATVGVGKDVAITCQLVAANWTNESYVSWNFNTRSPKYGNRSVTLNDGERMYAVEAIKDVKFPTLFISRVTESLLEFPVFKVTFYNGTNEVLSTVYTTRIQGVMSQGTQPSASATVISSDWHSTHLDTDFARSTEPKADFTNHLSSTAASVLSASLTSAARTSVSTIPITVSSLRTNLLASETQSFSASSPGQDATTVDMPGSIQVTSERLPSTRVTMFSTTPSGSSNVMAGSATDDMRTAADSTAATTKSGLSALSSYAPAGNIYSLSSSSGITVSPRATTVSSLFTIETTAPSTRLSSVRMSEPVPATFSQTTATATSLAATNASSSSAPTNDAASAVSTHVVPQSSSVTSSIRSVIVGSLPMTTKLNVVLATTGSTASQHLSAEAGTTAPNSPAVRSSSESAASATLADATLTQVTTSWPHSSLTKEQLLNVTQSSPPYHNTVDGGSLRTITNSAAPTVATAAATLWTAAGNFSEAMPTSTSAEGTQQGELQKASTLAAASTLISTLLSLSSAKSLSSSALYTAVNSESPSTPSSDVEPSISSAAVRTASTTSSTQTRFSSPLMTSAALNLTRNAATTNIAGSLSTAAPQGAAVTTSTATYSMTPQVHKSENASSELMTSVTISMPISALNVPATSSYAAALASSSPPTSPSAASASQTVVQTPTVSDSTAATVNVLPGDSISTVAPTKGSSLGSTSQKPSQIETKSTVRVQASTLRQTTRGIKSPQSDYASGASSCFLSHVALLILLLPLL